MSEEIKKLEDHEQLAAEEAAEIMYTEYCKGVGGKAFNGDPLPSWTEFRNDETKKVQSNAWVDAGRAILLYFVEQFVLSLND